MARIINACARAGELASIILVSFLAAVPVAADEALVAVAANFTDVMNELEAEFENGTEHRLSVSVGSTGKLYAQIVNGAPFDVLLAADADRPARLELEQHAVEGSRFTYALGRLALWSADSDLIGSDGARVLEQGGFRRLAIANPDLAPYGAAAMETLDALGVAETLRSRIVTGEDVNQAFAMVATGNAELGFVALSQVRSPQNRRPGSMWVVPPDLHAPIRQDAVLLQHGAGNEAAVAFLSFLAGDAARETIERHGYGAR